MPLVADLGRAELARRLGGPGLLLRTGPFVSRIQSNISLVADGIQLLYADNPVEATGGFADFQVRLRRSSGLRRFWHPQVRFYDNGREPFAPLPLAQAWPMFEWVMNWCVSNRAHSYLLLHAAVVERNGCAIILPAPPGSGKSTLCAALVCRGWRLLSDELTMVRRSDGMLVPLVRPVSLKNASIDVIRAFAPDAILSPSVPGTNKGTIAHLKAPPESVARVSEPARARHVVFPLYATGASTMLTPLSKGQLFMQVAENAFNYLVLGPDGFDCLAGMVDECDGHAFTYSRLDEAIALFDSLAGVTP
jgi:HprK-related kinase A